MTCIRKLVILLLTALCSSMAAQAARNNGPQSKPGVQAQPPREPRTSARTNSVWLRMTYLF